MLLQDIANRVKYINYIFIFTFRDINCAVLNRLEERTNPKQDKKKEERQQLLEKLRNGHIELRSYMTALGRLNYISVLILSKF